MRLLTRGGLHQIEMFPYRRGCACGSQPCKMTRTLHSRLSLSISDRGNEPGSLNMLCKKTTPRYCAFIIKKHQVCLIVYKHQRQPTVRAVTFLTKCPESEASVIPTSINSWHSMMDLSDVMPRNTSITSGKLRHWSILLECILTRVTPTRNRILSPS